MSRQPPQLDDRSLPGTEEAKLRLLEWSIEADAELHAQVQSLIAQAKSTVRTAAPWAAGAALVAGLFFGRKRKNRDSGEPSRGSPLASLGSILKVATTVAPVVMSFLRSRREER